MVTIKWDPNDRGEKALVTFRMPTVDGCRCLYLVGWFDEWHESVFRMERADNDGWLLTLELKPGIEYHYCFRTDDGKWVCDPDRLHALTPDELNTRNSFFINNNAIKEA